MFSQTRGLIAALAVIATGSFVFGARYRAPVTLSSDAISPAMNFAQVRMQGFVDDYPDVDTVDGYIGFSVRDAAGSLRINVYRDAARALILTQRIPMPGDRIEVEGALRIRDQLASLTVSDPTALVLQRAAGARLQPDAQIGQVVLFQGQLRRIRETTSLRILTLRDGGTQLDVLQPRALATVFGELQPLQVGDWFRVTGALGEFQGRRQLRTRTSADLQPAAVGQPFEVRPVFSLDVGLLGQWVAVRGNVRNLRASRSAARFDLVDDENRAVTIGLFDTWASLPFSQTLRDGDEMDVQGVLMENRGQLEIRPELTMDLRWRAQASR